MSRSEMIIKFIDEFVEQNGCPPTVREIGAAVGLASTSTVHGHLERLQKKGLLNKMADGTARTWKNTNTEVRQQHPLGQTAHECGNEDLVEGFEAACRGGDHELATGYKEELLRRLEMAATWYHG